MTLSEIRTSLAGRLRRPALWLAFLLAATVFSLLPITAWLRPPVRGSFLKEVAPDLLATFAYYFAFIWLSPIAWQWDGRPGHTSRPWYQWWAGFLGAEALAMLLGGFQDALYRLSGQPGLSGLSYLGYFCIHGPGLFLVGNLLSSRERMEQEREELRQRTDAAISEHLKGQMQPHVLFNTLNGLAELMKTDPEAAEVLIEAMSGFLHRVLEASHQKAWALREERDLLEDYLGMEATRLGPRLKVTWDWDPTCESLLVLPLLLQPLVENAIKHGINPAPAGGEIRLQATCEDPNLVLEVGNTAPDASPPPRRRTGLGLANLRRRLGLAYGSQANFQLEVGADGWTRARLSINLKAASRL